MAQRATTEQIPGKLGDLVIDRLLGRGMAGEVYLAHGRAGDRFVVKRLRKQTRDIVDLARFAREARLMSRLNHPNLMPVLHVAADADPPYYVMPYRSGLTVAERLGQGKIAVSMVTRIARDACAGLSEAHRLGIVHRDVKPGNLLLESCGRTVVLDFGLAKELDSAESLTGHGVLLGTPGYMSPEQCRGAAVDGSIDIYSLGVTLFELLLGHNPFSASDVVETLRRHLEEMPRRLDALVPHKVDTELGDLLHRMIAKNPAHRPSMKTCLETFTALARRSDQSARAATTCSQRPNLAPFRS